jgi:hypothetical protein
MSCNDRISDRCIKKTNAVCTTYEGTLSTNSELTQSPCLNIQDVIEDLNAQIDKIATEIDVKNLSNDTCLHYTEDPATDAVSVRTALHLVNSKLQDLMAFVGMQCDGSSVSDCPKAFTDDISCLNLNYGTLVFPCGDRPANLKEVLQLILTQIQP